MKYSVEYSKAAVRDLDRVWSEVFRASRSYDITERYLNDLMDIVESKSEYPLSGAPLYYEDRFTGYYFVGRFFVSGERCRLVCGGCSQYCEKAGNSTVDHWINHCSNGNQHAGGSSQYYCCNK